MDIAEEIDEYLRGYTDQIEDNEKVLDVGHELDTA